MITDMGMLYSRNKKKDIEWQRKEEVREINKRNLGVFMLKECGNEGADNTEPQKYLRKLLQGCIDNHQQYPNIDWSNVTLEISGMDGKEFLIVAGAGKTRVYAMLDSKDEVKIIHKK